MNCVLNVEPELKAELWAHLLPDAESHEQAAFLFCTPAEPDTDLKIEVVGSALLQAHDFAAQETDYLELSDTARIRVIKRAHHLGASLVELHSHPGPWPAAFSLADRSGLRATVAHMQWRLRGRPYIAIVVAPSGFDSLVWRQHARIPEPLAGIQVGETLLLPTNNSLEGWDSDRF